MIIINNIYVINYYCYVHFTQFYCQLLLHFLLLLMFILIAYLLLLLFLMFIISSPPSLCFTLLSLLLFSYCWRKSVFHLLLLLLLAENISCKWDNYHWKTLITIITVLFNDNYHSKHNNDYSRFLGWKVEENFATTIWRLLSISVFKGNSSITCTSLSPPSLFPHFFPCKYAISANNRFR